DRIHDASMRILETHGLELLSDAALDILAKAGATVDRGSRRARLDRGLVAAYVAEAPARFTLHARNPSRTVAIGANAIAFCAGSSAANCSDLDRGRPPGSIADYCDFLRLIQSLNIIHLAAGYPVEPIDIPPTVRHLDAYHAAATLTDRIWSPSAIGAQRVEDGIAMNCIARGITREELLAKPGLCSVINTNSPLRVDGPMLEGLMALAHAGQAAIITPFTLSGAMAPATLAGALALQNAEALGGVAFAPMGRPGAPVLYGAYTSDVDTESRAPALRPTDTPPPPARAGPPPPPLQAALPLVQRLCRQCRRRAGSLRIRDVDLGRRHGAREPREARRRLDGGRPRRVLREADRRCR